MAGKQDKSEVSYETVDWLLRRVLYLPKGWLALSIIFILLSMLNLSWLPKTGLSLAFQVTNTTAIFFALMWLPSLLRIFALVGGGVKTPVGEISGSGIKDLAKFLSSDELGTLIQETGKVEKTASSQTQQEVQQIHHELEAAYLERITTSKIREEMIQLTQRYNEMRIELEPSLERTRLMNSLAERMRILAPLAKFSADEIDAYLQSQLLGDHILGLSVVRISKNPAHFDQILPIIDLSQTAHEQWHALRTMEELIPYLNSEQKKRLQEVINRQRDYDPAKHQRINPDSDRYTLSSHLLEALGDI